MNKKSVAALGCLAGCIISVIVIIILLFSLGIIDDLFDDIGDLTPSKTKTITTTITNGVKRTVITERDSNSTDTTVQGNGYVPDPNAKIPKSFTLAPNVKVRPNIARTIQLQNYSNGLVSMSIPQGWTVGTGNSDHTHYTFMAYNPQNPDYKIFFSMKTEGYLKTQQMKIFYQRTYPSAPMAKLPVIDPQTTAAFYNVFTPAFLLSQNLLPFKVPVIKNFKVIQPLGKNTTGGEIDRAVYQNEQGKNVEGVFTATIKEVAIPPVVLLNVYNAVFFTAPEGELIDWMPVLNRCLSTIKFSDSFINGYYSEQKTTVRNAQALQAICNQTSDIITSGWNARQKTYDILSQKRSDATMGYERVRDTETNEIYKATVGFTDHDLHGRYEPITDDMYELPVAGYIEKQ